ncbi:hypothetical protein CEXT_226121 [Caerostris extrusa]|uniref:Uncharacterized protein n=1 Tax=Caerostris extrusa TaxID=172846 RepID=A0AAV4XY48_CAEEX|nr:hypothetical protein CEXT_226121 [Caerostris extrusa]
MNCVNLLGQGRPDSQIQLATARVLSPSYQIWNAVGLLAKCNCLQSLPPSYQIWNASTILAIVGRIEKTTGYCPGSCLLLSNMECVNLLGQGRPVSQMQLATARKPICFRSNMECVNPLVQDRPVSQIPLATARMPISFQLNMECVNLLGHCRPD